MLRFIAATVTQKQALKEISRRVIKSNYTPFLGTELVSEFIDSGASDSQIETGFDGLTIAYLNDKIIGFYIVKNELLHLIMVDVPFQHQGYGTEMLRQVEIEVFLNSDKILLQSFEENEATNNFYLKNGYRLTDTVFAEEIGKNMSCFMKN